MMRALVLRAFDTPNGMRVEEMPTPQPAPGQVRIKVAVVGVSFVDAFITQGAYQIKPDLPWIPGSECAGVVDAVGDGVDDFAAGDRVCALGWGGVMAELLCVDASSVARLPDSMDLETGAVFRVAYTTAWHALTDRARLLPNEKLLVLGAAGAVGHAAIELGKAAGATVIAAASTQEKREVALSAGADAAVASDPARLRQEVEAIVGRKAIDVVFDPVGGAASEAAFRLLGWNGRHAVVGFAAGGAIPAIPLNLPLLLEGSILGVNVGRFTTDFPQAAAANLRCVLDTYRAGRLMPRLSHRFALEDGAYAFACVRHERPSGRVVIVV